MWWAAVAVAVTQASIVMTGAAVRLTDSGLGCDDWPTCTEDSLAPAWSFHGWVEFGNRLFAPPPNRPRRCRQNYPEPKRPLRKQ